MLWLGRPTVALSINALYWFIRQTFSDERRVLLNPYRLEDYAMKVFGTVSVGTL